jgi:hypothetical protein
MTRLAGLLALSLALAGCDEQFHTLWHGEKLPSGDMVKVTSFNLVWGIEHDDRDVRKDSFAIEYVTAIPGADAARRDAEAMQVFELVRPASEKWGFRTATLAAFPRLERKGRYDLYAFEQAADGRWSFKRSEMKVFAND